MEIKINNLIKRYGSKTAVDIPDFTLHEGEILGPVSYTHLTLPTIA